MHANDETTEAEAMPAVRGTRARAWLRVGCFLACVLVPSLLWTAQRASAELSERALNAGRELERWAQRAGDEGTTLRINGQVLTLTTASTELPIDAVLDRFEGLCARDSGGTAEELTELAQQPKGLPEGFAAERFGVLRSAGEHEGTAACFARSGRGGLAQLFAAVGELAETGDLNAFGKLRYLFVRKSARGSGNHVITVSSEGPLPLLEMWPESGDAPGSDLPAGARPADSVRTLSAEAPGYALTTYESARSPAQALASYASQLASRGYRRIPLEAGEHASADRAEQAPSQVFAQGNDVLILFATEHEGTSGSLVSATRIVRRGYAAAGEERP